MITIDRRSFLRQGLMASLVAGLGGWTKSTLPSFNVPANEEDFWADLRAMFSLSSEIINLNNGAVSPQPYPVQEAYMRNYRYSNKGPSYYMWRKLDEQREPLRKRFADFCGVSPEEIAFNRNTTEGLNTIILGLDLKPGDVVVLSSFDYPNMMNAWKQRVARDSIRLEWVDLRLPEEDSELLAEKFISRISPRTRVVHLTHMMNWTGQVLPVSRIAKAAKEKGCEVIVDASHSFAHLDFKISDLHCDYLAASGHKWLCAPFGTGFMYIRKELIGKIWPLLSAPDPRSDNIRKFEHLGTRSFAAEMAMGAALDFHLTIGNERKMRRLRALKNYWMQNISSLPGIKLLTSFKDEMSGGIGAFEVIGKRA
ncbi:MAG: aminotransferase class V-fold PLP-dependent enzyme, partial [Chitinophagales bacterium]|nr:aminotransferase class V-fold PLP-dependent enzyme [Chitinophagales bacterium]